MVLFVPRGLQCQENTITAYDIHICKKNILVNCSVVKPECVLNKPEYCIVWQKQNRLTDLDFADDLAILAEEENVCQEMTTKFEEQSAQVGLNISREKTKVMGIAQRPSTQPIAIAQGNIEYVERFIYLGSVISRDGDVEADINTPLAKAAAVFRRLDNVWRSSTLSLKIKLDLCTSLIVSTAIYASETWKSTARIRQQLDVFHHRNLWKILGITWYVTID